MQSKRQEEFYSELINNVKEEYKQLVQKVSEKLGLLDTQVEGAKS